MNTIKRSVPAWLLLSLLSVPLVLFLYRQVQQVVVRHEMKEKLHNGKKDRSSLQTIRLAAHEVYWYEENREIIVNNTLFDVLSSKPVEGTDSVEFTGLFDYKETDIVFKINRMVQQRSKNDPLDQLMVQAMCLLCIPLQQEISICHTCGEADRHYNPFIIAALPAADLPVPAPPPWELFL